MTRYTRAPAYVPTRAIIDIGSNTVRLVIYGGPARAPEVLHNEKVTARLGKGVAENGKLGQRAMSTALASLARYRTLLELKGIAEVDVVATAAARDAVNGPEFLAQIRALGLTPRLLSGEEEAITSAHGVIGAFPRAQGVVGDLGGGSVELGFFAVYTLTANILNISVVVGKINEASKLHAVAQRDACGINRSVCPEVCPLRDGGWLHGHHTRHLRE